MTDHINNTTEIVCAYAANNALPAAALPKLIADIHAVVTNLGRAPVQPVSPEQISASVRPDAIISFIDGKAYRTLGHQFKRHGLTPSAYRERFGLPADYPTVAADYSKVRSDLAKARGLGTIVKKGTKPAKKVALRKAA